MSLATDRFEADHRSYSAYGRAERRPLEPEEVAMQTHIRVLGGIHLLLAGGLVLAALVVVVAVGGGGLLSGDLRTIGVTSGISFTIAVVLLGIAAPGLFTGFGLLGMRPWARPLGIVLAIVHLPGFPMGTALGVYSLWALTHADSAELFRRAP